MQKRYPVPVGGKNSRDILLALLCFMVAVLVLFLMERLVMRPAFLQLEQQQLREDSARIMGDIENGKLALAGTVNDWANWDATYAFALDRNPRYFEENYPDPAVFSRSSRIDMFAVFDLKENCLLKSVFLPSQNRQVSLQLLSGDKPAILGYLQPVLWHGHSLDGFLATEHGLMIVSARPILPNSQKGPSRGVFVMGRFLAGESLVEIARRTRVPWTLFTRNDEHLTNLEKEIFESLAASPSKPQERQEGPSLYRILRDVEAEPVGMIRVVSRGDILLLGKQTGLVLLTLLTSIAAVFLAFFVRYRIQIGRYVAALRRSEQELGDSEKLFRSIVTSSPMGMHFYRLDAEGRLIFTKANPSADRILNIDHRSLLGKTIEQAFPKLQGTHIPELYAQIARGEKGMEFFENTYAEGNISGIFEIYVFQTGQNGVASMYLDVTERKKTEAALLETKALYSRAISATTDAIWEWDLATGRTFFSPRWYEMLGYEDQEFPMVFETWKSLCHPEDFQLASKMITATLESSGAVKYRAEFRMRAMDGSWRWILGRGDVGSRDEEGKPLVLVGTHVDITERKQTEAALRESEAKYRSLSENASMGIWYINTEGFITHTNPAMREMLEIESMDELEGIPYQQFFSEESLPLVEKEHVGRLAGLKTSYEAILVGKRGTRRNVVITGTPMFDDSKQYIGKIGTFTDMTEHKKAEVTANREKLFSDDVIDSLPGIFYMYDADSHLVRWNRRHEEVTGYSSEEIAGKHNLDFFTEECREGIRQAVQQVFSEGFGYIEAPLLLKDGSQVPYLFTGRKVILDGSLYFLGVGIDISDRKRAEEERESLQIQLLQAQKMESVGRLAGGVAHDFNNMLGVIIGYTELALLQSRPDEPLKHHLEQIRSAAERSATLTQQLLAFARRQTIAPKILDLNDTVSGMLTMLRRLIGEEIELSWLPGDRLWRVLMDPSQIDQILVNLCVNARDSMQGDGKITIETANITFDETYCAVHEGFSPGDHVSLTISDTGCGMDRETIKGIFEPFFTTKEQGKGTGLGLATVYGIVKQNNASINVYSELDRGTTFKIYLPRVIGEGDEAASEGIEKLPLSRGETILLVEDEKTIMEMARTMLTALHYNVLVATDPEEALRLAENRDQAIDLLLTDVVMPRMNGRQLQENLISFRPELRCLFMSGYTADVIAHQGVLDEGLFFIQKPFSLQTLAARVRDVLDQVQGSSPDQPRGTTAGY